MEYKLTASNSEALSMLSAVTILGLLDAFEAKSLTIEDFRAIFIYPSMYEKLKMSSCNSLVLRAVDLCLELECVYDCFPDILSSSIDEIKNMLYQYLQSQTIPKSIVIK